MPQYSGGLQMPAISGGHEAYATHDGFIKEYANGSGGTKATATITSTLDVSAVAGDRITLTIAPQGGVPIPVEYVVPATVPNTADLQTQLLAAIRGNIKALGLGTYAATATTVTFTSLEVGQTVVFSASVTPGKAVVTIAQTQGVRAGQRIPAGRLVVTDSSVAQATVGQYDSRLEIAFLPTQNLNLGGSTQRFAGVTLDDCEELNYSIGGFPDGSDTADKAIQPNIRAKQSGYVTVELEQPFIEGSGAIPALLYRFTADGAFTELGTFSLTAGTGLIAVPGNPKIVALKNGGRTATVDFPKL